MVVLWAAEVGLGYVLAMRYRKLGAGAAAALQRLPDGAKRRQLIDAWWGRPVCGEHESPSPPGPDPLLASWCDGNDLNRHR